MAQTTLRITGYGLTQALPNIFPAPIVAKRAPTTADTGYQLGQLWVQPVNTSGTAVNSAWILTSIINNSANWSDFSGGAGSFTSLTVNPGPTNLSTVGNGAVTIGNSTNTGAVTINAGTGNVTITGNGNAIDIGIDAHANTIGLGSVTNGSLTTIQGGNGTGVGTAAIILATAAAGDIQIGTTTHTGTIYVGTSTAGETVSIATGASASTVNIANGSATGNVNIANDATSGNVRIGNDTAQNLVTISGQTFIHALNATSPAEVFDKTNTATGAIINLDKSRGTFTPITSGDDAGTINFRGLNSTFNSYVNGAQINAKSTGVITATAVPCDLEFYTTNATTLTQRAVISSDGNVSINASDSGVTLTTTGSVTMNGAAGTISIGADAAANTITIGSSTASNITNLASPITSLPGPVYIYTGSGAPANGLALHVGDLYINTSAATAATRMYIATGAGAWTNVTCAA